MKRVIENCRSVFATAAVLLAGIFSTAAHAADTAPAGVTLVDLTTPSTTCSYECSKTPNKFLPFNDSTSLTDANYRVLANTTSITVICDFGEDNAQIVNAYKVYMFSNGCNNRTPSAWTFSGSNDKETWDVLDTRSGENNWQNNESRFFSFKNLKSYRYYKQAFTATSGATDYIQFCRLEYFNVTDFTVSAAKLVDLGDGMYHLTGTFNDTLEGSVKLVFSAPGTKAVEVDLGAREPLSALDYTFDPVEIGLGTKAIYTAKLVVPDGAEGKETKLAGEFYLGGIATLPGEFRYKVTITPADTVKTTLGATTYANFPILVRLSEARIPGFSPSAMTPGFGGRDLLFRDENDTTLDFEVEEWNPEGESLVWVKVPTLSASTELTCYFGCDKLTEKALHSEGTWSRYVGVWHFAAREVGDMTVADATGHALSATAAKSLQKVTSPFGGTALTAGAVVRAPDYESAHSVGASFTASGWFKASSFASGDYVTVVKKKGSTWNADNGWYLELSSSVTTCKLVLTDTAQATVTDFTQNWHYYTVVSDGSTVKVYLDGSSSPNITKTYKVKANAEQYTLLSAKLIGDEYRIRKGAASAAETQLEYQTMKNKDFLAFGDVKSMDASMPAVSAQAIERLADGSFRITAEIALAEPKAIYAVVDDVDYPMTGAVGDLPRQYTATVSGLVADKTYGYGIKVVSASDNDMTVGGAETFSTGTVTIEKLTDADELGLVPGTFIVRRTDTDRDLVVAYAIDAGSTAIPGQSYEALSGTVTIPAGATEATIVLTPINDATIDEDVTLTLNLASGLYALGAAGTTSATMAIKNLPAPEGWNTWVARGESKLASVDANWSAGHAPRADEKVLFDGRFSTLDCEWDAAAPQTIAGWKQTEGYTGTVVFFTTFEAFDPTFTRLTINGDVELETGVWTHQDHKAAALRTQVYRLAVTTTGNLTLGAGAQITANGKGQRVAQSFWGACYGGTGGKYVDQNGQDSLSVFGETFGSVTEPTDLGMSAGADGGYSGNDPVAWAGGAIHLKVGGQLSLAGNVSANALMQKGWNTSTGSGGSIYLEAASISGSGNVQANGGGSGGSNCNQCGSGGRIALVVTADELELPLDKVTVQGGSVYAYQAASGTIFVKTAKSVNGTLYMKFNNVYGAYAYHPSSRLTTAIPAGETWTFDAIVFSGKGVLRVPTGTKLVLPNGLGSVTGNDYEGGILFDGGELEVPSGTAYCTGQWMLMAHADTVIPCGLELNGPKIGPVSTFRRLAKDFAGGHTVKVSGPVTLAGSSTFDLRGDAYTTGKVVQGTDKLTSGTYTAALAGLSALIDTTESASGTLTIKPSGIVIFVQ